MRFESREIKPYSVPVKGSELKVGEVYFRISYMDEYMHYPVMETLVFIGRDLDLDIIDKDPDLGDRVQVYFQDYESYAEGIRIDTLPKNNEAIF